MRESMLRLGLLAALMTGSQVRGLEVTPDASPPPSLLPVPIVDTEAGLTCTELPLHLIACKVTRPGFLGVDFVADASLAPYQKSIAITAYSPMIDTSFTVFGKNVSLQTDLKTIQMHSEYPDGLDVQQQFPAKDFVTPEITLELFTTDVFPESISGRSSRGQVLGRYPLREQVAIYRRNREEEKNSAPVILADSNAIFFNVPGSE